MKSPLYISQTTAPVPFTVGEEGQKPLGHFSKVKDARQFAETFVRHNDSYEIVDRVPVGIQRFNPITLACGPTVEQSDDGEFVLFTDHEKALAEMTATQDKLAFSIKETIRGNEIIDELRIERDQLRESNAALVKAMEVINIELCALVFNPDCPDWSPALCAGNTADADCLSKALLTTRETLTQHSK